MLGTILRGQKNLELMEKAPHNGRKSVLLAQKNYLLHFQNQRCINSYSGIGIFFIHFFTWRCYHFLFCVCRRCATALRVVQSPRAVRGSHGPGHCLRRNRKQGRARSHRAHEERSRQLRSTGRRDAMADFSFISPGNTVPKEIILN